MRSPRKPPPPAFDGIDDYEVADTAAIQAMARGEASAAQQVRALRFIIETLAKYYDIGYAPGGEGDRDTAFLAGRRFVGQQIVKQTKVRMKDAGRAEHARSEQPEPGPDSEQP